ncbi:MAG: sigma-70 family RNA polymerase sigma factor [Oscillospiraceae bacterium]|nr:sigma-70 family RNA polymerase sigma factor [Oscillospiraceae bacterium]
MSRKKQLNKIISENYEPILRYCKSKLSDDLFSAEDCTQDVFFLFVQKSGELNLKQNIRGWLYATADRIIKQYLKRKAKHTEYVTDSLDSVSDIPAEVEGRSAVFDELTDDEYILLKRYYSDKSERLYLAGELGISLNTLYKRIHDIKQKLHNNQKHKT